MECDGGIYISENARREDFMRLDLNEDNINDSSLCKAIRIFKDRIIGRYLSQIKNLNENSFENGFASMALCCLLIDTFYQFEYGVAETRENHRCYTYFLNKFLGDTFNTSNKRNRFYKDIRCGILHSAQTKNGSRLSCEQEGVIKIIDPNTRNSPISVNVVGMEEILTKYFNSYCDRVLSDRETQINFIRKMHLIFD